MKTTLMLGVPCLVSLAALPLFPQASGERPAASTLRFGDFDGDGLDDAYAVRPLAGDRLFKNLGDGTFLDVTRELGLSNVTGTGLALWQDFDRDGWLDLYLSSRSGASRLLRNDQGRAFLDVTLESGAAHGRGPELLAEWVDLDRDGWVDLHVVTADGELLLTNARGRFEATELPGPAELGEPVIAVLAPRAEDAEAAAGAPSNASAGGSPAGGAPPEPPPTTGAPSHTATPACLPSIRDEATGVCIGASSTPVLGKLYPLSTELNVDALGRVGMGTSTPSERLEIVGSLRTSGRLISTQSAEPPLEVVSSLKVDNLNCDLLDGFDSSAFSQLGQTIEGGEISDGTIADADVAASAAIAGTKVVPSFGSQPLSVLGLRTEPTVDVPNVIGGQSNTVQAGVRGATVGGGSFHEALASHSTIGGGQGHTVSGPRATVGGGELNTASGHWATVGGGAGNTASSLSATVGGGGGNIVSGQAATVSGGSGNEAPGGAAAVGGGDSNTASSLYSTVGGGYTNTASGDYASVGGGRDNLASGVNSTVPGGWDNIAAGDYSFAAGRTAQANHRGAFVWADSSTFVTFPSTSSHQFLIRAAGGVGIGTNDPEAALHVQLGSAGAVTAHSQSVAVFERAGGTFVSILSGDGDQKGILFGNASDAVSGGIVYDQAPVREAMQFRTGGNAIRMTIRDSGEVGIGTINPAFLLHVNGSAGKPGGGSWSVASDARLKRNVQDLEGALETLLALRGVTFEYTDPEAIGELPGERIGMIAQEVERVVPDWVETGDDGYKRLSIRGFEALAVEALRELHAEKDAESAARSAENAALRRRIAELEQRLERLESARPR